jgi:drug/metabolite transporter (DMT)-like permease
MGILLGLSAAFFWGTSDFCAANVARTLGALRAILWTQSVGLIAIVLLLCWQGTWPQATPRVLAIMLAIGVGQAAAVFLFYRAFEIGKLSIVAPITSGFAVVTAILALLSGERPSPLALGGALLLVVGVLFITRQASSEPASESEGEGEAEAATATTSRSTPAQSTPAGLALRGISEAVMAALAYGSVFWALDFVTPTLGPVWPLAALRIVAVLGLGSVFLLGRWRKKPVASQAAAIEWRSLFWPVMAVAAADTGAWLSFNAGTRSDDVAIVTALSSLYSAVAIFYGCVFWRERLQRTQWLGVGLILIGVLLVGVK